MNLKTMRSRGVGALPVLLVLSAIILASCSSTNVPAAVKPPVAVIEHNLLSGRIGTNGSIVVVKIDDTQQAHPQIGLDDADVVYIEQVEGGLTRLAAIFSSILPPQIGPVRSARISDIDLLAQYGHVAFAYSGAQRKLFPVIAAANLQDMGAARESSRMYTRDATRFAPVNLILQTAILQEEIAKRGYEIAQAKSPGWKFGPAPIGDKKLIRATMKWPANSYSVSWSSAQSRWLISQGGKVDLAASGKQLGATTFVIQMVSITPSIYHDKFGGNTPFSATIGSGTGFILRDGKVFDGLWTRADAASGTTWTTKEGAPLLFAPGHIWVALTNNVPRFTFPIPVAIPAATPTATK